MEHVLVVEEHPGIAAIRQGKVLAIVVVPVQVDVLVALETLGDVGDVRQTLGVRIGDILDHGLDGEYIGLGARRNVSGQLLVVIVCGILLDVDCHIGMGLVEPIGQCLEFGGHVE